MVYKVKASDCGCTSKIICFFVNGCRNVSDTAQRASGEEGVLFRLYLRSPKSGSPACAICTRIWWCLPVRSSISTRASPVCVVSLVVLYFKIRYFNSARFASFVSFFTTKDLLFRPSFTRFCSHKFLLALYN